MKVPLVLVVFLLPVLAIAQPRDNGRRKGVIYGVAIGQDGQPAKGLGLTAYPGPAVGETSFAVGGTLPYTRQTRLANIASRTLNYVDTPSVPMMKKRDTQSSALVPTATIVILGTLSLQSNIQKRSFECTFLPELAF